MATEVTLRLTAIAVTAASTAPSGLYSLFMETFLFVEVGVSEHRADRDGTTPRRSNGAAMGGQPCQNARSHSVFVCGAHVLSVSPASPSGEARRRSLNARNVPDRSSRAARPIHGSTAIRPAETLPDAAKGRK